MECEESNIFYMRNTTMENKIGLVLLKNVWIVFVLNHVW